MTDVQYLGNQHIYYNNNGEPRLVKQWRKKDFAGHYFVMSILENPQEDGVHWPMTLNVPGEGFGDDILQMYTNHSTLNDQDDYMFLLDKAYADATGLTCVKQDLTPTNPVEGKIPSNLVVDPHAWFSNEYTFSPVQPDGMTEEMVDVAAVEK